MTLKHLVLGAFVLGVAACAKEPEPVYLQPTYDKVGTPSCAAGYEVAVTDDGATVCAPITQ